MTIRQSISWIRDALSQVVGEAEAREMAEIIIEDIKGYSKVERLMYADRQLLPDTLDRIRRIVDEVISGVPLQYVLGNAWWRGRRLVVTPDVLIPRPETAQLVDMIVNRYADKSDLRVLDIGTGSGCIAVSLALDLKFAQVDAMDISATALDVAQRNAKALKARVNTIECDIYAANNHPTLSRASYDIIVSNPPYILDSESQSIDPRVKNHEPSTALFVPASDPIGIYSAIADYATEHLKVGGGLYFEINPLCVTQLRAMLKTKGFDDISVIADYKGTDRFITCSWTGK